MLKSLKLCRTLRIILPYLVAILSYSQGRYKLSDFIEIFLFILVQVLLAYNIRLAVTEFLLECDEVLWK